MHNRKMRHRGAYNGIPYLIFAALAAGFLLGAPQLAATSAITQSDKGTVSAVERKHLPFALAGYLGKTSSVLSRGFTEKDFTFTGSKTWVDDGDGNWRLKFLSSGTFTPKKKVKIDIFLVGGGGGGNSVTGSTGGGGGYTGIWASISLNANQSYLIEVGSGGTSNSNGGTTSGFGYSAIGGYGASVVSGGGGNGGSGGGAYANGYTAAGVGGSNGSNGTTVKSVPGGTGQGTATYEFGNTGLTLYSGGGGGGGSATSTGGGAGGAGGGANGGAGGQNGSSAVANTGGGGGGAGYTSGTKYGGFGGSGMAVIRNAR